MFSTAIFRINCGECPKSDILKPCYCDKEVIFCGGKESIELRNIFDRLSSTMILVNKIYKH
jgi:hypothetical protein